MNEALLIPIVGMLIPIVIVPTALGVKMCRQARELEHRERMRALELGRTLPQDEPWWSPPRLAAAIAVGVPIGVFLCVALAAQGANVREEVWAMAGSVGITAVISGSVLAGRHFAHRARAEELARLGDGKPAVDADAFDVVGARG